jgi:hypothetical protein
VLRGEAISRPIPLVEWQDALRLADQEAILPFFMAQLRGSGTPLPDAILDELTRAESDQMRSTFLWTSELRGILQAFAAQSIPVIPLKGPMLAERIYGSTDLRVSRDLDLLVQPRDLNAAGSVLAKLGFTGDSGLDEYDHQWRRGATLVELHFDVVNPLDFRFDTASAWERAAARQFLGQPVYRFAPADELLYLCLHGVRHRFERLNHVLDVARALECLGPEIAPMAFEDGPDATLRTLILLGWAMAERLDPRCSSNLRLHLPPATTAHVEKLADQLWTDLLERRGKPLDWQAQHRFYLEIESTTSGRLRRRIGQLGILTTRLIPEDYVFAGRLGVHQTGLVWVVRQCRLLARICGLNLATKTASGARKRP